MNATVPTRAAWSWYAVGVLLIAYVSSIIDRVVIGFLVGPIKHAFGVSDSHVGLLSGVAFTLFYTTLGLPAGRLTDTHSRRWLVCIGVALWSGATMYCGLAGSYAALFVGRVLVGVGEATLGPAAYSIMADAFPAARRAVAFSVYSMGITIGVGVANVVAGVAVAMKSAQASVVVPLVGVSIPSWQSVFFIVGTPGLLIALLALTIREPERRTASTVQGSEGNEGSQGNQGNQGNQENQTNPANATLRAAAKHFRARKRAFVCCMIGFGLFSMFNQGAGFWMPEFFVRSFGWQKPMIGQTQGWITAVFGTLGLLAGGRWTAKAEQRGVGDAKLRMLLVAGLGLFVSAGLLFGASFVDASGLLSALCLAPVMFCGFAPYGAATALVQDLTPAPLRGQMGALFLLVINLIGGGAGPILVSTLTDYVFTDARALRYSMMIVTVVALGSASTLYLWGIKKRVTLEAA